MIQQLIGSITKPSIKETRISPKHHDLRTTNISPLAVKVVDGLLEDGHQAYLVGGCVRDQLLGKTPKDFDVATSATPEQVKRLFRRTRIIGRRFRIVHVEERGEIIEVTTFRAAHSSIGNKVQAKQSKAGVLVRDNVYGSLEDDALRRDFTCNSLYFDIDTEEVIDMLGGVKDITRKVLRTIGDPKTRFQEDPVRMMRATRFQSKLGLKLDSKSSKQLKQQLSMLKEVSPARLFDEVIKLLLHSKAAESFRLSLSNGLLVQLFPYSGKIIATNNFYKEFVSLAMKSSEKRFQQGKSVSPFFLYSVLLWPDVEQAFKLQRENRVPAGKAMDIASSSVLAKQQAHITIPKRFSQSIRDTWYLQTQLPIRTGAKAARLLEHPKFRAAYDFLIMREAVDKNSDQLGSWWTKFQDASEAQRLDMMEEQNILFKQQSANSNKSGRTPRRRSKPSARK